MNKATKTVQFEPEWSPVWTTVHSTYSRTQSVFPCHRVSLVLQDFLLLAWWLVTTAATSDSTAGT